MAQTHDTLSPELADFIRAQPLFFVATAPLAASGHVNLSPKGLDTFRILSLAAPARIAYLDLTGSGNETAAHLRENARITFMFCAFHGPPKILRLYGIGHAIVPDHKEWPALRLLFPDFPGTRQIIAADISRIHTSCGFAVPRMQLLEQRDTLLQWADKKGPQGLLDYRAQKNQTSIDGLPAL